MMNKIYYVSALRTIANDFRNEGKGEQADIVLNAAVEFEDMKEYVFRTKKLLRQILQRIEVWDGVPDMIDELLELK